MIIIIKRIRVNERIRVKEVRVIGGEGEQLGVMSPPSAMNLAKDAGMDLVEVAPQVNPPVCRIMDYSKYKYEQEKKAREAKKKQRSTHLKEIKLRPNIEEHDYQVKLFHLQRFLKRGDKVRLILAFRGREMTHPEAGRHILERFTKDVTNLSEVEKPPTREGRFITTVLIPK